ncbi:hypothetical protein [Pseudooceanicola nanhaiensis]|jgi:hypothetical protein|uniref:hypothetical protein n=1 Tax=Pseudooceanicola nanhaiensis TaxID=375761 RepID=UPI003513E138
MATHNDDLATDLRRVTAPIHGQYPRPWMTDLADPTEADVFVVGRNQRNGYSVDQVTHEQHVEALLNRNGMTCRGLYDQLCQTSPTGRNIDRFSAKLKSVGAKVLETNVICFSTPMSADLTGEQRQLGTAIFEWVLDRIKPKVIVVHGAGAAKDLAQLSPAQLMVLMPSLAPPAFNKWSRDFDTVTDHVVSLVQRELER